MEFQYSTIDFGLQIVMRNCTDSAGGKGMGFGIYFKGLWSQGKWPSLWREQGLTRDITVLKLFPILVVIVGRGSQMINKRLLFHCDNLAVVHIINTMSSKSDRVMTLVRVLILQCLQYNIAIKAVHVPGVKNLICDALSRFQQK